MISPAGERAMLRAVGAELEAAGALVSFNGKSFDAPMLETRYLFHRLPWPAGRSGARRRAASFAAFLGRGRWVLAERSSNPQVLGARRIGDVSGMEIPARYFQFLRTGRRAAARAPSSNTTGSICLSLAGLTSRLLALLAGGPSAAQECEGGARARPHLSAIGVERPRRTRRFVRALELASPGWSRGSHRRAARARAQRSACAPLRGRGGPLAGAHRDARLPGARAAGGRRSARDSPRASCQRNLPAARAFALKEPGEPRRLRLARCRCAGA